MTSLPLPRTSLRSVLFLALVVFVLGASPAGAGGDMCPCWPEGVPLATPTLCYSSPGPATNAFAYFAPTPFLQATNFWCRDNGAFQGTSPTQSQACAESLQCLCNNPNPQPEVACNGVDDDCNPTTSDDPTSYEATQAMDVTSSGQIFSFSFGFAGASAPSGDATVTLCVQGDYDFSTEFATLLDENNNVLVASVPSSPQCASVPFCFDVVVPEATVDGWAADDTIEFTVENSTAVSGTLCPTQFVEVKIDYPTSCPSL